MHKYYFLKEILNNLISENDLSNLSLEKSNDDLSRLFRAFIMQFYNDCPDNQKSNSILAAISRCCVVLILHYGGIYKWWFFLVFLFISFLGLYYFNKK